MNINFMVGVLIALAVCFAGAWGELPSTKWPALEDLETMPPDEEARFVAEWEASFSKGLINGPGTMIGRFQLFPFSDDPLFFRMKYNNPALITCVVETYIAEYQCRLEESIRGGREELGWPDITEERKEFIDAKMSQYQADLQRSITQFGHLTENLGEEDRDALDLGETGLVDFHFFLEEMATTTFSPKVFDYLGAFGGGGGDARLEYHGRVQPERMLKNIFSATIGVRLGREANFATLYRSDTGAPLGIEFVFECIERIVELNPHLGERYHDQIIDLIKTHAKIYFRENDLEFSKKMRLLDYRHRVRALDLLRQIATVKDIPVVRWIAEDTQFHDVEMSASIEERLQAKRDRRAVIAPPEISTIAERLIEEIQTRAG